MKEEEKEDNSLIGRMNQLKKKWKKNKRKRMGYQKTH